MGRGDHASVLVAIIKQFQTVKECPMDEKFVAHVEALRPNLVRLQAMIPYTYATLPPGMPKHGVYVMSENGMPLYVGRSNNIRRRVSRHCNPGATHRMAAFAFRLAREATGRLVAGYVAGGGNTRDELMLDPTFVNAFNAAKARIRAMEFRFVEETDPTRQALLEIYLAVVLDTPYNDFDTH